MKKNKKIKLLILELVVVGIMVGLIPELFINGLRDLLGVCGFSSKVCNDLELQGAIQLVLAVLCNLIALSVSFVISKEYNSSEEE